MIRVKKMQFLGLFLLQCITSKVKTGKKQIKKRKYIATFELILQILPIYFYKKWKPMAIMYLFNEKTQKNSMFMLVVFQWQK